MYSLTVYFSFDMIYISIEIIDPCLDPVTSHLSYPETEGSVVKPMSNPIETKVNRILDKIKCHSEKTCTVLYQVEFLNVVPAP